MERQCWLGSCWLHCEWGKGSAFAYFDLRYCAILVRHLAIPLNATGRHFGRHWTPSIRVHLHILQLDQVHYLWIEFLSSMINGAGKNLLHTASMYGVSSRRSRENKINQWKWMPLVIFNRFYWPETIYLRCFWWLHFFFANTTANPFEMTPRIPTCSSTTVLSKDKWNRSIFNESGGSHGWSTRRRTN